MFAYLWVRNIMLGLAFYGGWHVFLYELEAIRSKVAFPHCQLLLLPVLPLIPCSLLPPLLSLLPAQAPSHSLSPFANHFTRCLPANPVHHHCANRCTVTSSTSAIRRKANIAAMPFGQPQASPSARCLKLPCTTSGPMRSSPCTPTSGLSPSTPSSTCSTCPTGGTCTSMQFIASCTLGRQAKVGGVVAVWALLYGCMGVEWAEVGGRCKHTFWLFKYSFLFLPVVCLCAVESLTGCRQQVFQTSASGCTTTSTTSITSIYSRYGPHL